MNRLQLTATSIAGVKVLQRNPMGDHRGFLERMYCTTELESVLGGKSVVQINRTLTSARGSVRGMHFQHPPYAETKFVSCIRGEILDIALDLRQHSPTFLRWHAEVLSAQNWRTLVVPEGCAHGFQTLEENCELIYFHTQAYRPEAEGGVNVRDPRIGITWPLVIGELSLRDAAFPMLAENYSGIVL